MSWQPAERPDWVRAINAGDVAPICDVASLPFARDALLGEARARLGLPDAGMADFCHAEFEDFAEDAFVEPLDRVLRALEQEAALTLTGRWLTRRFLLRLLEVRLQLMAYLRADPGVRDEPIERPLFVAGAPRTGTTILHDLLASDPAHRVPLGWELLRPLPPPAPPSASGAVADPRVAMADRELVLPQTVVSGLLSIHVYGGDKPKECLSAMSFAFLSEEFTARYHVPSYQSWLEQCDLTPAYRMHRLVLQILQRRTGPAAWVLKSPVHLHALPTLLRTYPDAQVAITHRDPLAVLASLTSLIATLRWAHSDEVDYPAIGKAHADRYRDTFDNLVDWTERGTLTADQTHHSHYADFLRDPTAVLQQLYAHFDRPYPADLSAPARGDHKSHRYDFADLNLDRAAERTALQRYQSHFGVPPEGGRS